MSTENKTPNAERVKTVLETIDLIDKQKRGWLATAARSEGKLIGERMIVLDKHERAFSQFMQDGEPHIKLELPAGTLNGVSHMDSAGAEKVKRHLEKIMPDAAPYAIWDFELYAKHKAAEDEGLIKQLRGVLREEGVEQRASDPLGEPDVVVAPVEVEKVARETVYEWSNGFRPQAENMYGWLRHEGFSPAWDFTEKDEKGWQKTCITLPVNEVEGLRALQRSNPARFGNTPEVKAALDQSQRDMEALVARDRARAEALTPEQRDWIEVIHYETGLNNTEALDLNEKLHDLSAKHFKLCHIDLAEGLSKDQGRARDVIETDIREVVAGLRGVKDAAFIYDPRGSTVGLQFESGRHNSFGSGGMYKVPLASAAVAALDDRAFWAEYSDRAGISGGYFVLEIDNTGHAAFVDIGREEEVGRIIDDAADKVAAVIDLSKMEAISLRDTNGNKVGEVRFAMDTPDGEQDENSVRLAIRLDNMAFEQDATGEVTRILREAVNKVRDREHSFALRDVNGNTVGQFEMRGELSLDNGQCIDMARALDEGKVYWADDSGMMALAEGEYRFVVTAGDFEPGYGQGEGEAWLVNAKGEKAPSYDDPQSVRESDFRELKSAEKIALRDVITGKVSLEEFEARFSDDDPAP